MMLPVVLALQVTSSILTGDDIASRSSESRIELCSKLAIEQERLSAFRIELYARAKEVLYLGANANLLAQTSAKDLNEVERFETRAAAQTMQSWMLDTVSVTALERELKKVRVHLCHVSPEQP